MTGKDIVGASSKLVAEGRQGSRKEKVRKNKHSGFGKKRPVE